MKYSKVTHGTVEMSANHILSHKEPICCGLNGNFPLQTPVSEHLTSSWWCSLGRSWNLQEEEKEPSEVETEAGLEV